MTKAVKHKINANPAVGHAQPFTDERRQRLRGAVLGAHGGMLVSVSAADLKSCLAVADAVSAAQQLVGINAELVDRLRRAEALAADVHHLRDQLVAARGQYGVLDGRIALALRVLNGAGL